jgi:hypothetical protein
LIDEVKFDSWKFFTNGNALGRCDIRQKNVKAISAGVARQAPNHRQRLGQKFKRADVAYICDRHLGGSHQLREENIGIGISIVPVVF